jgi:hypothetical protein
MKPILIRPENATLVLADLKEFRLERSKNDVLHLVFDGSAEAT